MVASRASNYVSREMTCGTSKGCSAYCGGRTVEGQGLLNQQYANEHGRRLLTFRAFLVLCLVAVAATTAASELSGAEAPDFVLKSVSGENLRLSEYRGQVVLLSFWATWCGDCRAQLEGLAELYSRYQGAGFELLAVSLDSDSRQLADSTRALKIDYPVLHDLGGVVGQQYAVESMPLIMLIDRDGIVRDVFQGYRRGNEEQYLERVRALLRE